MQGAEGLSATDGCVGGSFPAESPSRALRAASWKGGIQGEGKGVRPKASQSAKDFLIELPERDTRIGGAVGQAEDGRLRRELRTAKQTSRSGLSTANLICDGAEVLHEPVLEHDAVLAASKILVRAGGAAHCTRSGCTPRSRRRSCGLSALQCACHQAAQEEAPQEDVDKQRGEGGQESARHLHVPLHDLAACQVVEGHRDRPLRPGW